MTNHPPSVLWHCWLGHQTCENRYCVRADVKPCSINQSKAGLSDQNQCSLFWLPLRSICWFSLQL